MVHAKNYENMSTFVKVMQKKRWPLFSGHGVHVDVQKSSTRISILFYDNTEQMNYMLQQLSPTFSDKCNRIRSKINFGFSLRIA